VPASVVGDSGFSEASGNWWKKTFVAAGDQVPMTMESDSERARGDATNPGEMNMNFFEHKEK
jgi:hypothetical protein